LKFLVDFYNFKICDIWEEGNVTRREIKLSTFVP
jgi:hypothetical protein